MTKISNYELDETINSDDKVTGTDSATGQTKNFALSDLAEYFLAQGPIASLGYTSYVAVLTQAGTAAPTVDAVLVNTIGPITVSRTGVGAYFVSSAALFTGSKTDISFINNFQATTSNTNVTWQRIDANTIQLGSYSGATPTDAIINNARLEIRVYN